MKEILEQVDLTVLRKELVRAMRGDLTQSEINSRLGYSFNQCAKWESGEKRVLWTEFVQLADCLSINMRPIFVSPFRFFGEIEDYKSLIVYLSGGKKVTQLAKDLEVSRDKVSRWLNQKQSPTLDDILNVIFTYYPALLVNFIDGVIPIKNIPCLFKLYRNVIGFKDFLVENPYALGIGNCFRLEEYIKLERHVDGFAAKKVAVSLEEEKLAIKNLAKFGLIRTVKGKYELTQTFLHFQMKYADSIPIRNYYLEKAQEYLHKYPKQPPGCFMAYNCLVIPKENMRQVIDMCFDFYVGVQKLLATSEYPRKEVRYLNINMFKLE